MDRLQPHAATIHPGGAYLYRRTTQGNVLHAGVDLTAPRGTVVHAPADGVIVAVERADRSPFKGYGPQSVELLDDEGLYHLLAHLEPDDLADPRDPKHLASSRPGQRVEAGDAIGTVGKFNHTHWELRRQFLKGDPFDDALVVANTVDPLAWLADAENHVTVLPPLVVPRSGRPAPAPASRRPLSPRAPRATTGGSLLWIALLLAIALND